MSPWLRFDAAPDVADVPPCCNPGEDPGRVPLVLSVYTGVVAVPWPGAEPCGVGSNLSHPKPWKYSSGQACASCVVTTHSLPATGVPEVKPMATRAGMPSSRASAAMAKENCWQYPRLRVLEEVRQPALADDGRRVQRVPEAAPRGQPVLERDRVLERRLRPGCLHHRLGEVVQRQVGRGDLRVIAGGGRGLGGVVEVLRGRCRVEALHRVAEAGQLLAVVEHHQARPVGLQAASRGDRCRRIRHGQRVVLVLGNRSAQRDVRGHRRERAARRGPEAGLGGQLRAHVHQRGGPAEYLPALGSRQVVEYVDLEVLRVRWRYWCS